MKKWMMFVAGAVVGARLMYLFDPKLGRGRRATLRDKATHYLHDATDTVGSKSRHLRNKAKGMIARHWPHEVEEEVAG